LIDKEQVMNERIRELAKQSGTWEYYEINEGVGEDEKHLEKFAELIVRECADVAKETRWAVPPSQEQIARGIQQHFGVEE
jgi:hypothetical protein